MLRRLRAALVLLLAGCTPVVIPAGPATVAPQMANESFLMPDGARLPYRSWLPAGAPRAMLVVLHGFGDYSRNAFEIPAEIFVAQGIAVYAYDQRGFGASPHRGYWAGSETLAADAGIVTRALHARYPRAPIFLLGESMGAAVTLLAAARPDPPPVDGYVLMAPGLRGRATMSNFAKRTLEFVAHAIPAVGFSGSAPGFSPTDNEEAMRRWSEDPLTTKSFRVDAVYGLVNLMDDALAAAAQVRGRVLVLYGGHDRIVPAPGIRGLMQTLPETPQRRFGFYLQGYHLLLRDKQRQMVGQDIVGWMLDPGAPLASGAEAAGRDWLRECAKRAAGAP
jgi:acylglycerol lipase